MSEWPMPDWMVKILAEPTCSVPDAARVLGIGRNTGYEAAVSGQMKTLRFGRVLRVPSSWLCEQLQVRPPEAQRSDEAA